MSTSIGEESPTFKEHTRFHDVKFDPISNAEDEDEVPSSYIAPFAALLEEGTDSDCTIVVSLFAVSTPNPNERSQFRSAMRR